MKRLAAMVAACILSGTATAAEPSLCKSMCDSEKRECRADAQLAAADDADPPLTMPERNPFARTAQGQVPAESARAISGAGAQTRRMRKSAACDASYQRCTRACAAPARLDPAQ